MSDAKPVPPQYSDVKGLGDDFAAKVEEVRSYLQTQKDLEQLITEGKAEIFAMLRKSKQEAVFVGDARIRIQKGKETRKLSVEKLQKLKVPLSTIDASYVTTTGNPYVVITVKDDAEAEA